jgi:D-arabinose 1-dehydrogenase-like Zn-dependent alcohol dehydrogenase
MRAMQIVDFGKPLKLNSYDTPKPQGGEVLVRIGSSGVCHSDLHIWEGFFDLGMGKKLDVSTRGMKLPHTLGHEIAGEVVAVGPDAKNVRVGQRAVVYPWIGCGTCPACKGGDELLCPMPIRQLGTRKDGGYADYVMVPEAKYLVDYGNVPQELACTYACSGITAYSAIKKAMAVRGGLKKLLLIGAGGVGLAGVAIAKAVTDAEIIVADIDDSKLKAARETGANRTVNSKAPGSVKELVDAGGVDAAIDFVGAPSSVQFAVDALRRGGSLVVVGLFGGDTPLSIASMPLRMLSIQGSYVGSLDDLRELMALVREGKVPPLPFSTRPLEAAYDVLEELKAGKVVGRVILKP